uniref:U1-poneritoxin-Ng3g n=2 Tax=Neoponera goeldii TaxID=3057131 RepID=GTX3G_NEOGO|nr:RecName: Full=U1-poneritoxin-Ng3g; Short=U1-PONTX-Ng3g; AltName: Full=Poneratoxin; AltName: Full=Ponericin-G7 [Neoponera goeldii]
GLVDVLGKVGGLIKKLLPG